MEKVPAPKFRVNTMRLKCWDYSRNGYYFVVIKIKRFSGNLGRVMNGKMILNQYGKIVDHLWNKIPKIYRNVEIGYYSIMPNHIHGIIAIDSDQACVGAEHCSAPTKHKSGKNYGLLSKVVKSFKDVFIKTIHKRYHDYQFHWQRSFFDHIICNDNDLERIQKYIEENPLAWESKYK